MSQQPPKPTQNFRKPSALDEANAKLSELNATVEEQSKLIANLQEQVEHMRKQLFGRRREKIDPAQLRLFKQSSALLDQLLDQQLAPGEPAPKQARKKGHGRAPF